MTQLIYQFFHLIGLGKGATIDSLVAATLLLLLLATACLADKVCQKIFIPLINKIVSRTHTIWDDYLLNVKVLKGISHLIPPLFLYITFPWITGETELETDSLFVIIVERVINITLIVVIARLLLRVVSCASELSVSHERLQKHHIAGVFQFIKLAIFIVGGICVIAALIGRSPMSFIAGLGAAATVLMLIFKDTISGLVAGIQLSYNKMLKTGDWITLPQDDIEGFVEEVSLISVKIRGFDNTIYTVPPYALVSNVFQNWQAMADRGARRVKRSIFIDVNSIACCTPEEVETLKAKGLYSTEGGEAEHPINLSLYRRHIESLLRNDARVDKSYFTLLRQLQSTPEGLPLEFYFFFYETAFVKYERLMADYLDYFLALLPQFGLRVFQRPSGADLLNATHAPHPQEGA